MIQIAQIGVGRWGTNILRTLKAMHGVEVVVDPDDVAALDGVVIATPGSTHAKIALPFVQAGLPTFIEKPMTTTLKDAQRLAEEAQRSGALIFVGHIHLYNPAYLTAKELAQKVGRIRLLHFEGMAPGPVRDDMSVLWDWGPHGVSMAINLLGGPPVSVQAWGQRLLKPRSKLYDVVVVRASFSKEVDLLCSLSWLAPDKRTRLLVTGSKGSVVFDDRVEKKVALFRADKTSFPRYSAKPPLALELEAFIQAIRTRKQPLTDVKNGMDVMRVLAAAERSIKLDGKRVSC